MGQMHSLMSMHGGCLAKVECVVKGWLCKKVIDRTPNVHLTNNEQRTEVHNLIVDIFCV